MVQAVEGMPVKSEALNSNSSTTKINKTKTPKHIENTISRKQNAFLCQQILLEDAWKTLLNRKTVDIRT
jgi:hypothetical protein